jgi:hypothetical protein
VIFNTITSVETFASVKKIISYCEGLHKQELQGRVVPAARAEAHRCAATVKRGLATAEARNLFFRKYLEQGDNAKGRCFFGQSQGKGDVKEKHYE